MELKWENGYEDTRQLWRFNRTFMELKLVTLTVFEVDREVLIVPLWNWNNTASASIVGRFSFNRTFMELKYVFFTQDYFSNWF